MTSFAISCLFMASVYFPCYNDNTSSKRRFYCPLFNTFLAKMLGLRAVQIRDAD